MRSLTYFVGASLDGYVASADRSTTALEAAVPQSFLATMAEVYPDTLPGPVRRAIGIDERPNRNFDAVVMGRHTFSPAIEAGLADPYPHLDSYVISGTLDPVDHPAVDLVGDDPIGLVRRLKAEPGLDIWLCGGPTLAAHLVAEIDRVIVKTYPVLLGSAHPLFAGGVVPAELALERTEQFADGVLVSSFTTRPAPA